MYIFSKDGETVVNSDNVKCYDITYGVPNYDIVADDNFLGSYSIKEDAIKQLHEIIRQIESGMTSYQLR